MEMMLRCAMPDRPGALAELAGAIGEAGGDIQSVDVVDRTTAKDGTPVVVDDLVVAADGDRGASLLARVRAVPGVELQHAGPSRGVPGDAVTRLAVMLEALLTGQAEPDRAILTLLGGPLRAGSARLVPRGDAPPAQSRRLVLDLGNRVAVLERDYRFTETERERAEALVRLCMLTSPDAGCAGGTPERTAAGD